MALRENGGGPDLVAPMPFIYSYAHAIPMRVTGRPCNRLKLRDGFSGNSEKLFIHV